MEILKAIQHRNSRPFLEEPAPSEQEMREVYKAALRAPDHAWLRPWRYLEVRGEGRKIPSEEMLEKLEKSPYRAPMVIVLIADIKEHPKVPKIEQMLSLGAAAQNILLSVSSLGYGGVWRTGNMAFNPHVVKALELPENSEIIGYLYIGTPSKKEKAIPELNVEDFLTKLN